MLFEGAVLLFSHDEVASGTDLAKLYIDTLNEAEAAPEEVHFVRISKYAVTVIVVTMHCNVAITTPCPQAVPADTL